MLRDYRVICLFKRRQFIIRGRFKLSALRAESQSSFNGDSIKLPRKRSLSPASRPSPSLPPPSVDGLNKLYFEDRVKECRAN